MATLALNSSAEKISVFGMLMVLSYNFLSASKEVASGNIVQTIDPIALTALVFALVLLVFQGLSATKGMQVYTAPFLDKGLLLKLNVFSCGAWIGFFYSVKFLEPAIVSALMVGIGPALSTMLIPLWYKEGTIRRVDLLSAACILMSSAFILYIVATGNSSLGTLSLSNMMHGGGAAFLGSISMVGSSICSKKLSNNGAVPVAIMAHRFYVLVFVALLIAIITQANFGLLKAYWAQIAGLAILGVVLPLWALQIGIKHLEPMYVMILISTAPAFTCILQLFDARLAVEPAVYIGVAFLCASAMLPQLPWPDRKSV